jgi:hypothetical protein
MDSGKDAWVEHRQMETRQSTPGQASGDDPAQFLRELRQLRDGAGLGPAELAARAHYPYDLIRAAEAGPALPDLPVLSAYVRGCGGGTEEWEERWRSLTSAQTLPLMGARPAGTSTAASAGARIGSVTSPADAPDPSIIMAALDRVAEGMAVGNSAPLPSRPAVSTIDQRPDGANAAPSSAGARPVAGKTTGSVASTATTATTATTKPSVWEPAAKRSAWETTAAPSAPAAERATADAAPVADGTAGGAKPSAVQPSAVQPSDTAVAEAVTAAPTPTPTAPPTPAPSVPTRAQAPTSVPAPASAPPRTAAVPGNATSPTSGDRLIVHGWTGPAISGKSVLAAIVLVICVMIAALLIFA